MRHILSVALLAFAGALLGSLAVRDTHAAYCHTKFANGTWVEAREGVDFAFLLPVDGGTILHNEDVTAEDECFGAWKEVHTPATRRRLEATSQFGWASQWGWCTAEKTDTGGIEYPCPTPPTQYVTSFTCKDYVAQGGSYTSKRIAGENKCTVEYEDRSEAIRCGDLKASDLVTCPELYGYQSQAVFQKAGGDIVTFENKCYVYCTLTKPILEEICNMNYYADDLDGLEC